MSVDFEKLVDSVIGTSYRVRGMSMAGFDCLGLVLFLLREGFGIDIAYPVGPGIEKRIRHLMERFRRVESPEPGDLLCYSSVDGERHVALVEDARWCVEGSRLFAVRRREISTWPEFTIWRPVP